MILGYVVIEWNQASHMPSLADYGSDLFDSEADAQRAADHAQKITRAHGRRERHTVAEVTEIEADG